MAALAGRLGVEELADQSEMVAGPFDLLRARHRWLLVYDKAERPDRLAGLLPPRGDGHGLVTSRWSAWGARPRRCRVNVLARDESIAFLGKRTGSEDHAALDALAELLGTCRWPWEEPPPT